MDMFGHMPMAYGDTMSADQAVILFAGPNGWSEAGILTTNMMLQYTQPVLRIYDFGAVALGIPASQYFIIGRPQGSGNFGKIIGPRPVNYCFYMAFGQGCNVRNNNFMVSVGSGCLNNGRLNFAFYVTNCILQSFGFQVASQDMLFQANLPFMFISLEIPVREALECMLADMEGRDDQYLTELSSFNNSRTNQTNTNVVRQNQNTGPVSFGTPVTGPSGFGPYIPD